MARIHERQLLTRSERRIISTEKQSFNKLLLITIRSDWNNTSHWKGDEMSPIQNFILNLRIKRDKTLNQFAMKKIFVLILGLFLVSFVSAQSEAGSGGSNSGNSKRMWLGGEVTFGSMSDRDFTFGPHFGIMINDNMGVGGTVVFSSGDNSNSWGLEPFFRYYLPIVDRFSFYGDGFVGVGGGDSNTTVDGGEFNTFDFGVRVGMQFWFTPSWSIAASSPVLIYRSTDGNGTFGAGVNFNTVNFAFFFHF